MRRRLVESEPLTADNARRCLKWGMDPRGALWHNIAHYPRLPHVVGDYHLVEFADGSVMSFYVETFGSLKECPL